MNLQAKKVPMNLQAKKVPMNLQAQIVPMNLQAQKLQMTPLMKNQLAQMTHQAVPRTPHQLVKYPAIQLIQKKLNPQIVPRQQKLKLHQVVALWIYQMILVQNLIQVRVVQFPLNHLQELQLPQLRLLMQIPHLQTAHHLLGN